MFASLSLLAAVTLTLQGGQSRADARDFTALPPAAWAQQDPADSLYRAARQLLNRSRYAEAAARFRDLINRYPRSSYKPDAYYWAAFALYRTGEDASLKRAIDLLQTQAAAYPRAATRGDGDALLARVYGELARRGDSNAAQWIQAHASAAAPDSARGARQGCASEEDDLRVAAMNALLQMDAANAMPILRQILARRDPCSAELRRRAVFMLSQKRTDETEDLLLSTARNDPDNEVRQQAVFWLSQVGTDKAVSALDSILQAASDQELRDRAAFALSQVRSPRAAAALRDYAGREDAPEETREKAVFWLGQQRGEANAAFLRDLYAKVTPAELKERIIFSLAQMRSAENTRWLMDLALNTREDVELRKKALFWAGQSGADIADLVQLYDRTSDRDMKEQLIFVYSQRHDNAALEKMIDIARHETDRDLKKKAVFWLGQSHDPRAAQVLLEIINQCPARSSPSPRRSARQRFPPGRRPSDRASRAPPTARCASATPRGRACAATARARSPSTAPTAPAGIGASRRTRDGKPIRARARRARCGSPSR